MFQNPFSDGLKVEIDADTSGFDRSINSVMSKLGGFKGAVGALGGAIGALSTGALAGAAGKASEFEDAMADVEKVTDPETAAELGDRFQELGERIPISVTELARLGKEAGKFGAEAPDEIENFVSAVGKIQTATDLSAEKAGKRFAKIGNALDIPLKNTEDLGNAVNALADSMQTDTAEITGAALRSGNVLGQQLGLGEDAVLALTASLNEVSPTSRLAGSSLRRMGESLLDPRKVEDFAAALGMTPEKFRDMRDESPEELLRTTAEAMEESGDTATDLRGVLGKAANDFSKLGGQLGTVEEAQGTVNEQLDDGTSLQREMGIRTDTFSGQMRLLKNQIGNVARTIGKNLLPPLTDLLGFISDGVDRFSELNEKTDGLLGTFGLAGTAIGGLATALLAFAGGPITAVIGGISLLAGAFATDFAGIRSKAASVVSDLSGHFDKMDGLFGDLQQSFEDLTSALEVGDLAAVFDELREIVVDSVSAAADVLFGESGLSGGLIGEALGKLADWLRSDGIDLIRSGFEAYGETVRAVLSDMAGALTGDDDSIIGSAFQRLATYIKTNGTEDLVTALRIAGKALLAAFSGFLDGLTGEEGEASLQAALGQAAGWVRSNGPSLLRSAATAVVDAFIWAASALGRRLVSAAQTAVQNAVTWLTSIGKEDFVAAAAALGRGLRAGIIGWVKVQGKLWKLFTNLVTALAEYIGSGQALTDLKAAFEALMEGTKFVLRGYLKLNGILWDEFAGFIGDLASYIGSGQAFTDIVEAHKAMLNGVVDVFVAFFEALFYGSKIKDFFMDVASYVRSGVGYSLVTGAFETLVDGITSIFDRLSFDGVKSALQSVADKAASVLEDVQQLTDGDIDIGADDGGGGSGGGGGPGPGSGRSPPTAGELGNASGAAPAPSLDTGGLISESGLAEVHRGEAIIPSDMDIDGGTTNHFDITIRADADEVGQALRRELRSHGFRP